MEPPRKPAKTRVPILDPLQNRFSTRAFDPGRAVPFGSLLALFEAARWAPSCFNDQPWKFLFWEKRSDAEGFRSALSALSTGNQLWARNAPVLIASLARHHFAHDRSPNRWGEHDTGMATMALLVEAELQGLTAHDMGGFDPEKVRTLFDVPEDWHPMSMIAVGFHGSLSLLDDSLRSREMADRQREPLEQVAFEGGWARLLRER